MNNYIEIYTDGACSGNQFANNVGGWAFLIRYLEHEKSDYGREENTTNNRMEILAVIKALQAVKRTNFKVIVYSDSQYVVQTINNNWKKNKNNDLWDILEKEIKRFNEIEFIQVKGHSNDHFNNYVDELAVKATRS